MPYLDEPVNHHTLHVFLVGIARGVAKLDAHQRQGFLDCLQVDLQSMPVSSEQKQDQLDRLHQALESLVGKALDCT